MVGKQFKKGTLSYGQQGKDEPQNYVHTDAAHKYAVYIVLEETMISASFTYVFHDLAVHTRIYHQCIDPTCLYD